MNKRNLLSALLADTSEERRMKCDIILQTTDDCGLSDLDKIHVTEIWQHEIEGIIMLVVEGYGECELEEFEGCTSQIYDEILKQKLQESAS